MHLPEGMHRTVEEGRETRYGFRISGKDGLNNALAEAVKDNFADCGRADIKTRYAGQILRLHVSR